MHARKNGGMYTSQPLSFTHNPHTQIPVYFSCTNNEFNNHFAKMRIMNQDIHHIQCQAYSSQKLSPR
jgi:hypothetical protein